MNINLMALIVLHFHSHPRTGHCKSFSDQDLQSYAKMQAQNGNYINLGMLGFPIDYTSPTFGMYIVEPLNAKIIGEIGTADFIKCEDIYYISENDIYSIGRLHNPNLGTEIVRQYLTLRSNDKVCAEEIVPNTGTQIKPTCVGYTDNTGRLCFIYL